jgi:HlyD family secretion protein
MTLRKGLVIIVVLLIIAAGAFWILHSKSTSANVSEKDLISVQRHDFPLLIDASGTLEALRTVDVTPPQLRRERQFELVRIIEEGKQVEPGDFLMEFDRTDIEERLRDEVANFQRVQENRQKRRLDSDLQRKNQRLSLEQAKTDLEKLEIKMSSQVDLLSGIEVEETRIQLEAARRKVEFQQKKVDYQTKSSQLDLQILRSNERHYRQRIDDYQDALDELTVRAPKSGVVIYKREWNNEAKKVGDEVFFIEPVIEIPELSSIRARVQVDEVDAGRVRVGQDATISVEAVGDSLSGEVVSVGSILKQVDYDRAQKVCDVYIQIDAEDMEKLRPGMKFNAQILVDKYPDVVVVPLSSIHEQGGHSFVQVWKPETNTLEWREITLRTNDGINAVVESGLDGDEKIRIKPRV